jgi:probable addiction module antidote protein
MDIRAERQAGKGSDKEGSMEIQDLDISEYLDDPEVIAEYLNAAIEENDPAFFLRAVGDVAKARGMTHISKESGVKREALYRALSGNVQPKFDTIMKVLRAVNSKLKVEQSGP